MLSNLCIFSHWKTNFSSVCLPFRQEQKFPKQMFFPVQTLWEYKILTNLLQKEVTNKKNTSSIILKILFLKGFLSTSTGTTWENYSKYYEAKLTIISAKGLTTEKTNYMWSLSPRSHSLASTMYTCQSIFSQEF